MFVLSFQSVNQMRQCPVDWIWMSQILNKFPIWYLPNHIVSVLVYALKEWIKSSLLPSVNSNTVYFIFSTKFCFFEVEKVIDLLPTLGYNIYVMLSLWWFQRHFAWSCLCNNKLNNLNSKHLTPCYREYNCILLWPLTMAPVVGN